MIKRYFITFYWIKFYGFIFNMRTQVKSRLVQVLLGIMVGFRVGEYWILNTYCWCLVLVTSRISKLWLIVKNRFGYVHKNKNKNNTFLIDRKINLVGTSCLYYNLVYIFLKFNSCMRKIFKYYYLFTTRWLRIRHLSK